MKCQHPGSNHSDDVVTVHHGTTEPVILCGYHAQRGPQTFRELRAAGVLS